MDNIQNLPNAGLEDVFDIQSLYSKMNTESSEERQKTLSALREKARRYLPETERTAKYLNALIEYKRLQLGLSVEEYAPLLGMPVSAYQKTFLQPNVRFGSYYFSYLAQFCYLFGYDLDVSKEAAVPQTVADLYAQEFAAFLISLGPDALDDISEAIVNSKHIVSKVKPTAARLILKTKNTFYNNENPVPNKLNYNSYISEAKKQLNALNKSSTTQQEN